MSLSPDQWKQVNALFDAAVDLPPPDWAGFLAREAQDRAVRTEVEALLKSHAASSSFLANPMANLSPQSLMSRLGKGQKPPKAFTPGETVADFKIVRIIGEGAFARVYLAEQVSLARSVALKVTHNVGREAQTMAGLEHDHIVQVYSEAIDAQADLRMICMQLVTGATLQTVIDQLAKMPAEERSGGKILEVVDRAATGQVPFNAAAMKDRESLATMDYTSACLWIGARLADALSFAHDRGILHLDVKPANILINQYGRPMLTDFNVSLTRTDLDAQDLSVLGGTLSYMSPEHHRVFSTRDFSADQAIDGRSDVYALGVVVTELLTCRRVEKKTDETTGSTFLSHTEDLPEEVASVLHKAVRVRPDERFATCDELGEAFENCREIGRIKDRIPVSSRLMKWARAHPVLAVVLLATLPQVAGSVVNITYNSVRIVNELSPEQQKTFMDLVLPYNLIFYSLGVWIVWRQVSFLLRSLKARRDRYMPDPKSMAALRLRALSTPYTMVLAATVGWLPGSYLFPAMIERLEGEISPKVYLHFLVSFLSSWMITLTYSFLLIELVTLLVIYPRFWTGCCKIREASRFELRKVGRRLKVFQALAGLIPLAGAMMIVGASPGSMDPQAYYVFQVLVVGLISLGMCGFVFAMKTSDNIKKAAAAFTG